MADKPKDESITKAALRQCASATEMLLIANDNCREADRILLSRKALKLTDSEIETWQQARGHWGNIRMILRKFLNIEDRKEICQDDSSPSD